MLLFLSVCGFAARADEPAQIGRAALTRAVAAPADQSAPAAEPQVAARGQPAATPDAAAQTSNNRANVGRAALTNPTAVRAASGDTAAQNEIVRSAASRSAVMAAAQSEERREENEAFRANEKGIANQSSPVRRAGVSLRPSVAEVGGRATIGNTGTMTGSNINPESGRVATRTERAAISAATIMETRDTLGAVSELTKACQDQYIDCMDQFCNVIDANQKRCSCSDRISNYSRVEGAVKEANNQLNEVAQRIRYVGLTADEIRAIMTATEAEMAMQGQRDTTENRNMLEQIEKLIKSPETFATESNWGSLDLDLDFDFENADSLADLFSLDFVSRGGSFSNMRGTQLFNAAKNRCSHVLNTCKKNGANVSQITARFDMEIDKDCIAYEKGLEKMNSTLKTNVRAATQMLQKARLAVLQNQNTYDAKGCIGALEQCMTDDMVCGDNYLKCLDPTKKFIDENGYVVLGGDIVTIRKFMGDLDVGNINSTTLTNAESLSSMTTDYCSTGLGKDGKCIIRYLLTKIGTGDAATSGLCRPVLDKCRRISYNNSGKYVKHNDVVINYIQRAMVSIKAGQERIIADFASTCMTDIAQCYSQQVTQVNSWAQNASAANIYNVMRGACRNVALTCAYAVFSAPEERVSPTGLCYTADKCIESVSNIFYQSMLCPDNSTYSDTSTPPASSSINGTLQGWVNTRCQCNTDFMVYNGACVTKEECKLGGIAIPNAEVGGTGGGIQNFLYCRCKAGHTYKSEPTPGTPVCGGLSYCCQQ